MIHFETTLGRFTVELYEKEAPVTVANFLKYIDEGFFDGTTFHRIVPGFVIQGGGFTEDMSQKHTHPPIKNEADNGLKNERGTLSMARTNDVNSATSQFFVNLKDNDFLDHHARQFRLRGVRTRDRRDGRDRQDRRGQDGPAPRPSRTCRSRP